MHPQCPWERAKTQAFALQGLTVEIDIQPLGHLDFHPGQARTHKQVVDPPATGQQVL